MVSCHVCGTEVISGWICGVIPAHDKYKLGLCPTHDTPAERTIVEKEWEALLQGELAFLLAERRAVAQPPVACEIRIRFLDGGVKILRCLSYNVTSDKELLVLNTERMHEFYPLQHIRSFQVHEIDPLAPDRATGT